jgi:hypothetical protein
MLRRSEADVRSQDQTQSARCPSLATKRTNNRVIAILNLTTVMRATVCVVSLFLPVVLTLSDSCSAAWSTMESDPNFQFWIGSAERHCYVALQNEVTQCCSQADYRDERFTCRPCTAVCRHARLESFCNEFYGQGCVADYAVSVRHPVAMQGSVCLPSACLGEPTEAMRAFYPGLGVDVSVSCPTDTLGRAVVGVGVTVVVLLLIWGVYLMVKAPASATKKAEENKLA